MGLLAMHVVRGKRVVHCAASRTRFCGKEFMTQWTAHKNAPGRSWDPSFLVFTLL
jgi:hypothetical protein